MWSPCECVTIHTKRVNKDTNLVQYCLSRGMFKTKFPITHTIWSSWWTQGLFQTTLAFLFFFLHLVLVLIFRSVSFPCIHQHYKLFPHLYFFLLCGISSYLLSYFLCNCCLSKSFFLFIIAFTTQERHFKISLVALHTGFWYLLWIILPSSGELLALT